MSELIEEQVNYVKSKAKKENSVESSMITRDGGAATSGARGAATAGDQGAATSGYYGVATAGHGGVTTAGYCGAATVGNYGAATSKGVVVVGKYGVGTVRGNGVKGKGGLRSVIAIAEENEGNGKIRHWKTIYIDGEKYKPNVFYGLDEDGNVYELP